MTPRLLTIAEMVREGDTIIDVGTDHAYIPIYLVQSKKIKHALATDVNDGPIFRAKKNIEANSLSGQIATQKANGLLGVDTSLYSTIIIAGMGGKLISDILHGCDSLAGKRLILQPMTASDQLRRYLNAGGFRILREKIVQEENKLYVIIEAIMCEDDLYTEGELLLGKMNHKELLFPKLKEQLIVKLKKRIAGLSVAKNQNIDEIKKMKSILEEIMQ